jgi:bacitracin synthase 3
MKAQMNVNHLTLQGKLEESFGQFPDNIALESENRSLSYSEVERRANYIANWITSKGMKKGTFIGILLADRMELIFTIIAIIKAGCVFIPLDPAYPGKRIETMIKTTDIGMVIIDKINYQRFARYEEDTDGRNAAIAAVEFIRIDWLFLKGEPHWWRKNPSVSYDPGDKIYIYFTSGTTGTPRAILGKNGSLLHFIHWEINQFGIDETFRFSQFTPPGFDVFLRDILVPLSAGAVICIPNYQEVLLNADRLLPWIAINRITLIHCVPSLFRLFNAHLLPSEGKSTSKHLQYILFAGERLNPRELKRWYERNGEHTQLVNLYGPTETTLAKVFYLIKRSDVDKKNIPIGKPIDGTRLIILDQDRDICDELVVGELYIRTPYRSYGYYNDPGLNKQKFILNPFGNDPNDIIYKTGDLARMLPDGNIELIGRVDRQVKIRGRRIELEEVETVLHIHPDLKEAAVIKKDANGDNEFLHAFIVPKKETVTVKEKEFFISNIKEYLLNELPDYMVPTFFTSLEQLPRKTNLKVDFDGLADMLKQEEKEYIFPRNEVENKLVDIWGDLLGLEKGKIGVTSGFFQLGGNSLNLMTLISWIHRVFDIRISLGEIFNNPTIEKQAVLIIGTDKDKHAPIEPIEKRDYYPLSSAQKRMYVLYQMDASSTRYNLSSVTILNGELHLDRFEHAIRGLVHRHESLRTSFHISTDVPVQRVHDRVDLEIKYNDIEEAEIKVEVEEKHLEGTNGLTPLLRNFICPFDLSKAPLLRVGLIKLGQKKHIFMYDLHHIITDGISQELLKNDFLTLYTNRQLPPLGIHYRDYSHWQNQQKQKQTMRQQQEYWLKEFAEEITILNLPTDYVRPAVYSFEGSNVNFAITNQDIQKLRQLALEENVTLYMVFLAIYFLFLGKVSGQEEIIVGTPTAGRIHEHLEKIIGMFINTLALKCSPQGGKPHRKFLAEIKEKTVKAFENQEYQFEDLVNQLELPRDISRNPVFDVMFVHHDIMTMAGSTPAVEESGLSSTPWQYPEKTSKFDLTLQIIESNEGLDFSFEYNTNLFTRETIERFIVYSKNIISWVLKNRHRQISQLEILSEQEKREILWDINDTAADYPHDMTIDRLFAQQVEKTPNHIALIGTSFRTSSHHTVYLSYRKLNTTANRLAGILREKGVKADTPAAIMANHSIEVVNGILAILTAGGAYLPIEPNYPDQRIKYMLEDSGARVLLASLPDQVKVKKESIALIDIYQLFSFSPSTLTSNCQVSATNLVYIIYTSGSSGQPKGVMVEHRSLVNYIWWAARTYVKDEGVNFPLYTSISFDLTVTSIFTPLVSGRAIIVYDAEEEDRRFLIEKVIEDKNIGVVKLTPSHLKLIKEKKISPGVSIKRFIVGGEDLETQLAGETHRNFWGDIEIYNEYGPTEAVVGCMIYQFNPGEKNYKSVPIGGPIDNIKIYILDKERVPVPIGVTGELSIAGAGLARGYLNRPELTAEKFVRAEICHSSLGIRSSKLSLNDRCPMTNRRLYRTGDLVKWLPGRNIQFLGRIDQQVKIKGFRIELGEIERQLLNYEGIKEALVMMRKHAAGDKYLCAYIIPCPPPGGNLSPAAKPLKLSQLRSYLVDHLPGYMIPAFFVTLNHFPLTPNGKIDRSALPEPYEAGLGSDSTYAAPRNEIEKKLLETWQQVLGRNLIGIHDNFFELGGDSIKTIQIASRMNEAGYKFNLRDIFLKPKISELAPLVKKIARTPDQGIITGIVPLTPIQEWFFENSPVDNVNNHHFNLSVVLYFAEGLEREAAQKIFSKLQEHHDALRTTFKSIGGKIRQTIHDLDYPLQVKEYDLRGQDNTLAAMEQKADEIQASIDLETGPLMKPGLFRLDDGDRLLITIHHLVVDGVSWRILLEDIDNLYRQYKKGQPLALPLKTDSYKLWAEKIYEYANNQFPPAEKTYWETMASMNPDPIKKDFNEEHNDIKDTETLSFDLTPEQTHLLLTRVNDAFGTEINDILITSLGTAIRETWGNHRCIIDLEGHGREEILNDINLNRTIGWFTSIFPVILDMSYEHEPARQIKEVKETLHQVPHKGIGYGIFHYLTPGEHSAKMAPGLTSQISFNYLGQFDAQLEQLSFKIAAEGMGRQQSPGKQRKYELDVSGMIANKKLNLGVTFNRKQYKKETIEMLLSCYQTELTRLIFYCSSRKEKEYTPSDLTYKKLAIDTLDCLSSQYKIEDIYTLTPMQEGMLFHSIYDKNTTAYFEQTSYRLRGDLDVEAVRKSFNELFKRYGILRTAFIYEGKGIDCPLQLVLKHREVEFFYDDLRWLDKEYTRDQRERLIKEFIENDRHRGFDLAKDVLMRLAVLRWDDAGYEFVWSHHHILMDGWCTGILIKEFFEIYNSYLQNRPYKLSAVKPFRAYIQWLEKKDKDESQQYWGKYLQGYEQLAEIPKINLHGHYRCQQGEPGQRGQGHCYKNERFAFHLEKEETLRLKELAWKNNVTLNTVIQGIWGILLAKYNDRQDVVFGAVVSGRPSEIEGVETMVGLFINTIPVRISNNEKIPFNQLLHRVQQDGIDSELHHYYPLPEIQSAHPLKQNLLDHILIFENYPIIEQIYGAVLNGGDNKKKPLWEISHVRRFEQTNYDFNLVIGPGEQLVIIFQYNQNTYDSGFIRQMAGHFKCVLRQVLGPTVPRVDEINFLTEDEQKQLLWEFNHIGPNYFPQKAVSQLFEEQAAKGPGGIAVIEADSRSNPANREEYILISYRSLNEKANQLAKWLKEKGLKPDDIAAIMIKHSLEMIIAILGVWKAGAAYLPIDLEYPGERIIYLLENSAVQLVINDNHEHAEGEKWIGVNIYDALMPIRETPNPGTVLQPVHAAYVIYTSGSTGRPKGVIVEHRSLTNTLFHRKEEYRMDSSSISLQLFSFSFDGFLTSFFTPIISGAKVIFPGGKVKGDLEKIKEAIFNHQVTNFISVPSLYEAIIENITGKEAASLKVVTLAGEKLLPHLLEKTRQKNKNLEIVNEYGVTEAAVMSTIYRHQEGSDQIVIGKPIANTSMYILDHLHQLQAIGVPGELGIFGIGVARGYLNQPELTRERFIKIEIKVKAKVNSYRPQLSHIYLTGDLGRWLPNGDIEFLGRSDHQVKIRGFRIELGEIENQLLKYEKIKETVVVVKEEQYGDKYLCAYVTADKEFKVSELKEYLADELPGFMVPSYFVRLEQIPLTPNGKIDRKALPTVEPGESGQEYFAPRNEVEERLVEIWGEVLKIEKDKIGLDSNFFELGGHSLKSILLVARIHKELDVKITLSEIFSAPTPRGLVGFIDKAVKERFFSIKPVEKKQYHALSWAQLRLYIIQQMDEKTIGYNITQGVMLAGNLDVKKLESAFRELIRRHENLRTSIRIVGNEPVQIIHQQVEFTLENDETQSNEKEIPRLIKGFIRPFDLNKPPFFRIGLKKLEQKKYLLIMDIHHIITDAVSYITSIRELMALYRDRALPPLRLQYKDYSEWQHSQDGQESLKLQEDYWLDQFKGEIPVLNLPIDFPRPGKRDFHGKTIHFMLGSELSKKLKMLAKETGATTYMILLSVYTILLSKYSRQEDIVVGSPVSARRHIDLEKIMGIFVNMLAMRNRPGGHKTFKQFLKEVKENALIAYENQDYPFNRLAMTLGQQGSMSRNPLFDTVFQLNPETPQLKENNTQPDEADNPIDIHAYDMEDRQCVFDMILMAVEQEAGVMLSLVYSTALFKKATGEKLARHFVEIFEQVSRDNDIELKDISISHRLLRTKSKALQEEQDVDKAFAF